MRFMVLVKANQDSESGALPGKEIVDAMGKYNEELIRAGVLLAADGLHPSTRGARIKFSGGKHTVTDGPFTETNELLAGFWMIQVKSREEAIEWAMRAPFGEGEERELRQVFEASDFPPEILSPEDAAREQSWRDEQRRQAQA